jgi:hypothetical protein
MIATQHTEATRKKLREAGFFLRLLATVDKATVMTPEPEAPDFYLSAFFSAARAVQWTLKKERTDEWNAWNHGWFTALTDAEKANYQFLIDQRNNIHKAGGPEITITVANVSLMEFMREVSLQGGNVFIGTGMPGTPQPTFSKQEKTFTALPGQTLGAVCQPLFDLVTRLVDDFERAHPPT